MVLPPSSEFSSPVLGGPIPTKSSRTFMDKSFTVDADGRGLSPLKTSVSEHRFQSNPIVYIGSPQGNTGQDLAGSRHRRRLQDGGVQAARPPPGARSHGIEHQVTGKTFALGLHHYH